MEVGTTPIVRVGRNGDANNGDTSRKVRIVEEVRLNSVVLGGCLRWRRVRCDRVEEEVWFNSLVLGGCLRGRRRGKLRVEEEVWFNSLVLGGCFRRRGGK